MKLGNDQKKDLDVLQKLGLEYGDLEYGDTLPARKLYEDLEYGDTLPARKLYELLYERIPSTRDVCGYGDGQERAFEWRICGDPEGQESYRKARAAKLGPES